MFCLSKIPGSGFYSLGPELDIRKMFLIARLKGITVTRSASPQKSRDSPSHELIAG
jgi:hypothetical protein